MAKKLNVEQLKAELKEASWPQRDYSSYYSKASREEQKILDLAAEAYIESGSRANLSAFLRCVHNYGSDISRYAFEKFLRKRKQRHEREEGEIGS